MPVHNWTRVDAGLFHAFHQRWISALCDAFNTGAFPHDYFALPEQSIYGPMPDMVAFGLSLASEEECHRQQAEVYARKADRIAVRHRHSQVVAVVEIVSPGNKAGRSELHAFVDKAADLVRQDIHLLVIDLFPPGPRDPQGMHKALWDEFVEEDYALPPNKPLTLAAYDAGPPRVAYVEPVGVGDVLPDMPLFLKPECYVAAPLEATYQASWAVFPAALKGLLEGPATESREGG